MLPSKLSRAAHRAAAAPPTATCYACLANPHTHQRRHSSSKASSSSADRYSNKPAGPAAKAATSTPAEEQQPVTTAPETRPPQRNAKGRARIPRRPSATAQDGSKKTLPAEPVDQFAGLPSVPSVQSLSESDRSLSNFFSLHRPMSITHTFPPPTTPETFSKIFTPPPSREDPWANGNSAERRPEDVIYTLNTTIETLENSAASGAQDDGVRWEIIHESASNAQHEGGGGVHRLDGHPHQQPRLRSLEELVAQFKPFRPPPPPVPFPDYDATATKTAKGREKKTPASGSSSSASASPGQGHTTANKPKRKTFTTTITVTESTYANGRKTYSASSSPIVALAEAESPLSSQTEAQSSTRGLTRRERVRKLRAQGLDMVAPSTTYNGAAEGAPQHVVAYRAGGFGWRGGRVGRMYLISVKRQRKLKMKKHKYKKLMKRTRTLRRRLERN